MRLPADRRGLEWVLRAATLTALAWLIVLASHPSGPRGRIVVDLADWEAVRPEWAWRPQADSLTVVLGAAPAPAIRDWLVALRGSGTVVAWSDVGLAPIAIELEPRRDPAGGVLGRLAGPPGGGVALADGLGPLDSVVLGSGGGATVRLPPVAGALRASLGATTAWAPSDTAGSHRRILLLGSAGWEAKFVGAALEERGWVVDARYAVAPGIDVLQGAPSPFDTATHAAVIVLDSAGSRYGEQIARYVRSGGGLVLEGGPSATLRALAPGSTVGPVRHAAAITFEPGAPRRALTFVELRSLVPEAVTLETRDGRPVIAARRVGAGRVVQVGYRDSWRWRMQGGEGSVAAHRAWWAGLVAGVAYATLGAEQAADPAPFASLVQLLGAPSHLPPARAPPVPLAPWLVLIVVLCLLLEWSSRRLRGAR